MTERVVITAAAPLCSLGRTLDELRDSWQAGHSGIRPITIVDEAWYPAHEGGEIPDFDARKLVEKRQRKHLKLMTRPVRIGVAAARAAWLALEGPLPDSARRAAFVGAGLHVDEGGDFVEPLRRSYDGEGQFELRRWADDGIEVLNPLWLIKGLSNNVLAFASLFLQFRGVNDNLCDGEVAGLLAVGEAYHALREERCDIALAGGYGTYLTLEDMVGLHLLDRLDPPPGEGAAFFVLEREGDARAAGRTPLAAVLGFGSCMPGADPMDRATAMAGLTAGELDHVLRDVSSRLGNCHGGRGALALAVALCHPGERIGVVIEAPGETLAAVVIEVEAC